MKLSRIIENDSEVKLKNVIIAKHISKFAKALTKNKKDCVISISGQTGEGKSVLGLLIAKEYDKRFDYDRNLIYSRRELKEKIETFPASAFIIDEAINVLYKREWNKGTQKDLIKLLNICRSKGHLLIFIQPAFTDMDKDIRRERIRLWLYVAKRGTGIVYRPVKSIGGEEDPWELKELDKITKKFINKLGVFLGILEGSYRSKNFLSFLRWDNISKEEYEKYEEVKDAKKYADETETLFSEKDLEKQIWKRTISLLQILQKTGYLKRGFYQTVAIFFDKTISSVSLAMREARTKNINNDDDIEDGDVIQI